MCPPWSATEVWSPYSIAISQSRPLFDWCGHEPTVGIPIAKLQILYTFYSCTRTEVLLESRSEIILWYLSMLLKESVDMEY